MHALRVRLASRFYSLWGGGGVQAVNFTFSNQDVLLGLVVFPFLPGILMS